MASPVRLAFSPDSDDIFMFWPLLEGRIDTEGLSFVHETADTQTLNARAADADVDVIAVSMARMASLSDRYLLLPHGASVGRGYGPVVVAPPGHSERPLASLKGARIAVPGLDTTSYVVLRLLLPEFEAVVVPIAPYERVFEALRSGTVDAALLIHEGRLTYEREGFGLVADIGVGWAELTSGLPLPLGCNAIRRSLGAETIAKVSRLCRASIAWALAHRDEVMDALLASEKRAGLALDQPLLDRYLAMYANEDTRSMAPDVVRAIAELVARGRAAGVLAGAGAIEMSP